MILQENQEGKSVKKFMFEKEKEMYNESSSVLPDTRSKCMG